MILILSKPFNPGDADPGKNYTHLHLELMVYNSSAYLVQLSYVYGTLDDDNFFVPGKSVGLQSITLEAEELNTLQGEMSKPGEPALPSCIRLAYEHLKARLDIEGTIDYELPASPDAPSASQA